MPRLIDADALQKAMFSYYACVNEHSTKENYSGDTLMDYEVADLIEDCIDNAPTIDPESIPEVKRLKELVRDMSDYFPACMNCEGRTVLFERTDACIYEQDSIDSVIYCSQRGVQNIMAIHDENRRLKAAERPHGRWLYADGYNTCSVCKDEVAEYDDCGRRQCFYLCPHCGAIMDLKEETP